MAKQLRLDLEDSRIRSWEEKVENQTGGASKELHLERHWSALQRSGN